MTQNIKNFFREKKVIRHLLEMVLIVLVIGIIFSVKNSMISSATTNTLLLTLAGDSIGEGIFALDSTKTLPSELEKINPSWFIRNYSYSGSSLSGGQPFGFFVPPINPFYTATLEGDATIILLGTNDWGYSVATGTFQQNYANFLNNLSASSQSKIVCVTPIWRSNETQPNKLGSYLSEFRQIIQNECQVRNFPVIDGTNLVPHDLSYFADGLHPNALGYKEYAANLSIKLNNIINPQTSTTTSGGGSSGK